MNNTLKSKIIIKHRLLRCCAISAPICIIFLFWAFLVLLNAKREEMVGELIGSFIFFSIPVLLVCMVIFLITLGLKKLTYTLHDDKIISNFDGPWRYSATIAYKDIKEVELKQGIFQRKFNVGSIDITTNATKERAGFEIYNIENYQEVYDFLIKKVAESNNKT